MTEPEQRQRPSDRKRRSGNSTLRVSANATELAAMRLRAVELRISGLPWNQVAEQLGVTYETAYGYVRHVLSQRRDEAVPALRAIEDARLDKVVAAATEIIEAHPGTELALKAADRILRASATRAALHGLNAPVEVMVTEHTALDAEISGLLQQQEALNQRTRDRIIEGQVVEGAGEITA